MKQALLNQIHLYAAPGSLRIQLLSRSLIILALLLILVGTFQYLFMRDVIYSNKAESLHSQLMSMPRFSLQGTDAYSEYPTTVTGEIPPQGNNGNNGSLVPPAKPAYDSETAYNSQPDNPPQYFMPDASLAYINGDGNFYDLSVGMYGKSAPQLEPEDYQNFESSDERQSLTYYVLVDHNGQEELVVMDRLHDGPGSQPGIIQISTSTAPLKDLLWRQLSTFLILASLALLIGLLALLPVLRKTMVPLSNMVAASEQIDAGNLDRRFPTRQGQVEIDQLAESFNGMMERLEASFIAEKETKEQMRRFIADASHELRTPLTSIHGFIEVLLRGAAEQPEQLEKALKSMMGESRRLRNLVNDLIILTRLDSAPHIEMREGSLTGIINDMEAQLRLLAGQRRLNMAIGPDLKSCYNADQMRQVVLNLVQNAVQHTDAADGCIIISLQEKDAGVLLSVHDNGPGIGAAHLPHVFDRFYRSDSSRARKHGGSGLGLAITRSIVEAHGGHIQVESTEGAGCSFHVWLPGPQLHSV